MIISSITLLLAVSSVTTANAATLIPGAILTPEQSTLLNDTTQLSIIQSEIASDILEEYPNITEADLLDQTLSTLNNDHFGNKLDTQSLQNIRSQTVSTVQDYEHISVLDLSGGEDYVSIIYGENQENDETLFYFFEKLCAYSSHNTPSFPENGYYYEDYDFSYIETLYDNMNEAYDLIHAFLTGIALGSVAIGVLFPPLFLFISAGATILIAEEIWDYYEISRSGIFSEFNTYEEAVLFDYILNNVDLNYNDVNDFKDTLSCIKDDAIDYANIYYHDTGYYDETSDNNTLNAYQHACWSSMLTCTYGADFAKNITDAHEYGPLVNGDFDPKSISMDLLNNESGRYAGNRWLTHESEYVNTVASGNYFYHVYDRKLNLSKYILHCVAYGWYIPYNFYACIGLDTPLVSHSPLRYNYNRLGLINTNFGETTPHNPVLYYPTFC